MSIALTATITMYAYIRGLTSSARTDYLRRSSTRKHLRQHWLSRTRMRASILGTSRMSERSKTRQNRCSTKIPPIFWDDYTHASFVLHSIALPLAIAALSHFLRNPSICTRRMRPLRTDEPRIDLHEIMSCYMMNSPRTRLSSDMMSFMIWLSPLVSFTTVSMRCSSTCSSLPTSPIAGLAASTGMNCPIQNMFDYRRLEHQHCTTLPVPRVRKAHCS